MPYPTWHEFSGRAFSPAVFMRIISGENFIIHLWMRGCRFGWPDVAGRPGPVTSGRPGPGRLTRTRPAQSGRLTRTGRPHPSRTCVAARARPNLRSRRVSDIGPPRAIHRCKADWQGFHSHYNSAQSGANQRRECTCTVHRGRPARPAT